MIARLARLRTTVPAPGWMALALIAGFAAGIAIGTARPLLIEGVRLIGNLWIDCLRMTIVPLIFALVVSSMASLATRRGGSGNGGATIGRRLPPLIVALLLVAAVVAVTLAPVLFALHPLAPEVAAALRAGAVAPPAAPPLAWPDAIRSFVPVNVVASAAAGAFVPLVIFAAVFGLALGRIDPARAEPALAPFRGVADAMILVVGWVLRVAPAGIFALAFAIGATAGIGAVIALGWYILVHALVSLAIIAILYLLVPAFGRVPLGRFARALAPAQAVAAGTQSSIASLPAMLASANRIGVADSDAGVILSFSVAVFKVTAGSGTIVTSLGMAWLAGVDISPAQLIATIPLAMLATLTVLGVPGPGSVVAATTPVALALGAPVELLAIVLAVDTIPDMFRTTANVTADVAVATLVAPPGEG